MKKASDESQSKGILEHPTITSRICQGHKHQRKPEKPSQPWGAWGGGLATWGAVSWRNPGTEKGKFESSVNCELADANYYVQRVNKPEPPVAQHRVRSISCEKPHWERICKEYIYVWFIYSRITVLYTRNEHNLVNQLYLTKTNSCWISKHSWRSAQPGAPQSVATEKEPSWQPSKPQILSLKCRKMEWRWDGGWCKTELSIANHLPPGHVAIDI